MEINETWLPIVGGLLLLLLVVWKGWRWLIIGRPNLRWYQLNQLIVPGEEIELIAQNERGGTKSWHFHAKNCSVMYFLSTDGRESLDINVSGMVGIIIYFQNGKVTGFVRPGGIRHDTENISIQMSSYAMNLLQRVKARAVAYPFDKST